MKIKLFCSYFILIASLAYSQGKSGVHEIYTYVEGGDSFDYGKFIMYKTSAVWYNNDGELFPITDDFDTAMACDRDDFDDNLIPSGSSSNDRYGIFHTASFISYFPTQHVVFANGRYALTISHVRNNYVKGTFTIYLDYEVDNYPQGNSNDDIWIKFTIGETSYAVEIKWNSDTDFEEASEFESFSIAEMKNFTPSKQKLEDYLWMYNSNNHPHLEWNPYHDTNILGYNVYRKVTTSSGTQTYIEFTTDTFYTDSEFTLDPKNGDDLVEYWIKTKITSTQESLESNHRSTKGISQIQWKEISSVDKINYDFYLRQNYPNPFNPTTNIKYTIQASPNPSGGGAFVQLKVYDVLGNVVATLINDYKTAGRYEVQFNAEGLPSGLYFYRIIAGNLHQTRKMILLR